jgi:AmiR/NasT family two-component response regulator
MVIMSESKVYVLWSNPLFQEVIQLLLNGSPLDVVGNSSDHGQARSEIKTLSPDIVIIETTDASQESNEETFAFLRSGSRVIRLSLADNDLSIYRRERRTVRGIDDLIAVMMNDHEDSAAGEGHL